MQHIGKSTKGNRKEEVTMTKKSLPKLIIISFIIFTLTGCKSGNQPVNERQLLADINASSTYLTATKQVNFMSIEVEKRITDEDDRLDQVFVFVSGESDDLRCSVAYELRYTLYNEGWMLESVNDRNYELWDVKPKKGVPEEILTEAIDPFMQYGNHPPLTSEGYVPYDEIVLTDTRENFEDGSADYDYDVITNYTYMTSTDHLTLECFLNPITAEWEVSCKRTGKDRDWSKICGSWFYYYEDDGMFGHERLLMVYIYSFDQGTFTGEYSDTIKSWDGTKDFDYGTINLTPTMDDYKDWYEDNGDLNVGAWNMDYVTYSDENIELQFSRDSGIRLDSSRALTKQ